MALKEYFLKHGKINLIFAAILLSLNLAYFFVYFSLLGLTFSSLHFFFIAAAAFSCFLMFNFLRHKFWRFFCYFFMFIFYLAALVNFAYFRVYGAFVDFSPEQTAQLNATMLDHLKDYYFKIPGELYLLTIVTFIAVVTNFVFYRRFTEEKVARVLFISRPINEWSRRPLRQIMVLVILFAFVNLVAFGVTSYLYNNPRETWWDVKKQVADLGFWGYFYAQVYSQIKAAQAADREINWLDKTQELYQAASSGSSVANVALPKPAGAQNILFVQLESVGSWALENSQTPMPFLKSLADQYSSTLDFHGNSCETINAEFSTLCSFWPDSYEPIGYSHKDRDYYCLPSVLKERYGYTTSFFHANTPDFWSRDVLIPKWGFENLYMVPFFKQKESDHKVFKRAVEVLSETKQPFLGYLVAFTSHDPHNDELIKYQQEKNNLNIKPFSGKIDSVLRTSELSEESLRKYFGFLKASDDALKILFDEMRAHNMLDDTIVIIFGDHRYYNFFSGNAIENFNLYNKIPLVVIVPGAEKQIIPSPTSQIDLAPAILRLIEQENYQKPENFVGESFWGQSYEPAALNKCLGQVYFTNGEAIIEGNAKTRLYRFLSGEESMENPTAWLKLLSSLTEASDNYIFSR